MRKTLTAAGVTAGLLATSAFGLAVVDPFTAVAQEGSATTTAPDTTDTERPAPGDRIRAALQGLVDDGTLNAAQVDAVVTALDDARPDHGGRRHLGARLDGVAEILGIDDADLVTALRDGQTLAEIAAANDVSVDTVVEALVGQAEARIDAAVEAGRLTAEEATTKKAELTDRITAMVNGERPERAPFGGRGFGGRRGPGA